MNNDVNFSGGNIPQLLLFYKYLSVMTSFSQVELLFYYLNNSKDTFLAL